MRYKLVDVRGEVEENVEFGTCELCFFVGSLGYDVWVVEDASGKVYEFQNGSWSGGYFFEEFMGEDDFTVLDVAEKLPLLNLPRDLDDFDFWNAVYLIENWFYSNNMEEEEYSDEYKIESIEEQVRARREALGF